MCERSLRKSVLYFCVFVALFSMNLVLAEQKPLRIQELIPENWMEFPAIEPAIPSNYILAEVEGYTIWALKEDVANFEKGGEDLVTSTVIILRHTDGLKQTGPNSFSNVKEIKQTFKKMGMKNLKSKKLSWGSYPVFAVEGIRPDGTIMKAAWIGLNTEEGLVMFMRAFFPKNKDINSIWSNFISNTKQLPEPDFFRAKGMDMQDGYTIYTYATAKVKVTAEKRISDGLLALKFEPLSSKTTYKVESTKEQLLDTNWKNKEPCIKIEGRLTQVDGYYGTLVNDMVLTVLPKQVTEFSFDIDQEKHPTNTVIVIMPQNKDVKSSEAEVKIEPGNKEH
ncbi:MAG: hypothetical protein LLF94_04560 [Chlamydiales bacterium]|nr:hypothetical protein [Chlamydiales bacterium]